MMTTNEQFEIAHQHLVVTDAVLSQIWKPWEIKRRIEERLFFDERLMSNAAHWFPMEDAPMDGTSIIGLYDDCEAAIKWSKRPVCMLGSRNGGHPPGWATDGSETDNNLPMDAPKAWRPLIKTADIAKCAELNPKLLKD